jgi:hypothetical protein
MTGGKWRQGKHIDIFGHQSSIFAVFKLVEACVIMHDEIFQTLAAGDVMLLKPFLDPTPPTVQPQPGLLGSPNLACLDSHVFGKLKRHL